MEYPVVDLIFEVIPEDGDLDPEYPQSEGVVVALRASGLEMSRSELAERRSQLRG